MKLTFSTLGCPAWSVDDIIRNGKAYGYDGVELRTQTDGNHFSPDASIAEAAELGRRFRDGGLPIASLMGYSTFAHTDASRVKENAALLTKLVSLASACGARYVRTFAGKLPEGAARESMVTTVAQAIRPVARQAADQGVTIALETHDDWCAGDRVMAVVQEIDSSGFGIVYDIHNTFHSGLEPWAVTYAKVRKHICYCHVKDGYTGADGKVHYVMLGAGDLPLRDILARFQADGYTGNFSFEWEKKWYADLEAPERVFPHYVYQMRRLWGATPGMAPAR